MLVALSLAACVAPAAPRTTETGAKTTTGHATSPAPHATPSSGAGRAPSPAASAPPLHLTGGAPDSVAFAGTVVVDPAYIVAHHAGHLLTGDGAGLITEDGAGILAHDGGTVVSQGGGNVIVPAGLIGSDGAGLVSRGGGAVKAQPYRVQEEAAASPQALVAAAGMAVFARSLATGKPLPVGLDEHGNPAYAVYSDMRGRYTLHLPPGTQNVEVVARVLPVADDAMRYDRIVPPDRTAGVGVSDDTTAVTDYLEQGYAAAMEIVLRGDPALVHAVMGTGAVTGDTIYLDLAALAGRSKLPPQDDPAYHALALRMAEVVVGGADLKTVVIDMKTLSRDNALAKTIWAPTVPGYEHGVPALDGMADTARKNRELVQSRFQDLGRAAAIATLHEKLAPGTDAERLFDQPGQINIYVATQIVPKHLAENQSVGQATQDMLQSLGTPPATGYVEGFQAMFSPIFDTLMLAPHDHPEVLAQLEELIKGAATP